MKTKETGKISTKEVILETINKDVTQNNKHKHNKRDKKKRKQKIVTKTRIKWNEKN